mmetsp:Transcript_28363/g.46604  ORF Transcript_28363/g.46604 Transcript_28363/m.46604 type:complete len:283 (+) Transcript_28363:67-915(+)
MAIDFTFEFPSQLRYSTVFLLFILTAFVVWFLGFLFVWPREMVTKALGNVGVAIKRIRRTVQEMERKTFHLAGLLLPINYHLLLTFVRGFTQYHGIIIITLLTWLWFVVDLSRVYIPVVNRNFPLQKIARPNELHSLSGVSFFMIGNWLAIVFFPPRIAICALLFMILGDMSAALFGISFGNIKIGKKSLEGTTAMFVVCFFIGFNVFYDIHMREYPVFLGALVAAVVELYEPFGINDNLTIPFFSCLALQFGFHRISTCVRQYGWREFLDYSIVETLVQET